MIPPKKRRTAIHLETDEKEEESRLLHAWQEWPARFLDPFRPPKQVKEAARRRQVEGRA